MVSEHDVGGECGRARHSLVDVGLAPETDRHSRHGALPLCATYCREQMQHHLVGRANEVDHRHQGKHAHAWRRGDLRVSPTK